MTVMKIKDVFDEIKKKERDIGGDKPIFLTRLNDK